MFALPVLLSPPSPNLPWSLCRYKLEVKQIWIEEFEHRLGAPLGPATLDGAGKVYTREFAHGTVSFDTTSNKGRFQWTKTGRPSTSSPHLSPGSPHKSHVKHDDEEVSRLLEIEELKNTIHSLPAAEAARRFAALRRRTTPPPRQDKIDHFVVPTPSNIYLDPVTFPIKRHMSGSRYPWWHTCAPTASLIARVLDSIAGYVLVGHELSDACCCATAR